jgi:hypothetical protein
LFINFFAIKLCRIRTQIFGFKLYYNIVVVVIKYVHTNIIRTPSSLIAMNTVVM